MIWDLTTFWPRAAHPLAPPVLRRARRPRAADPLPLGARQGAGRHSERNQLVLSGHSQGSLIVLATVSRLDEDQLPRTRVITYGSQIRALYGRIFPRVFGPDVVGYQPTTGRPR